MIAVIVLVSVFGCSIKQLNDIPSINVEVFYQTGPKIIKSEKLIFWVKNKSKECIVFPYDFGVKIFIERGNSWLEVKNLMKYQPVRDITLEAEGNVFDSMVIYLYPDLSEIEIITQTNFNAVISGRFCNNRDIIFKKNIPFIVIP